MDNSVLETYAGLEGQELLEPVIRDFRGRVALVSSFGAESAVLLHMVAEVDPATPVIFLDTGKLFPETGAYRDRLVRLLGLTRVQTVRPDAADLLLHDPEGTLHRHNPDLCCHVRKTLPLGTATAGFDALISGRKRFHGGERARLEPLAAVDGRLKVEPLAHFSALDILGYMAARDSASPPAGGTRLPLDRLHAVHYAVRNGRKSARWPLGGKRQDGVRNSLDGKRPAHPHHAPGGRSCGGRLLT